MNLKKEVLFVLLILFSSIIFGQENWSYNKLKEAFASNLNKDDSLAQLYANVHLKKAKNNGDIDKIADSYIYLSQLKNLEIAIKYCDSAIQLTRVRNTNKHPITGYMMKGYFYYINGKDKKSTKAYLIAHDYALKSDNKEHLIYINSQIGNLKSISGKHDEALKIYKETLRIIKSQSIQTKNNQDNYLFILDNLSKGYLRKKVLDSSAIYINLGLKLSDSLKRKDFYYDFVLSHATLNFFKKNYKASLDSINTIKPYLNGMSLLMCHYYKGKIFKKSTQQNYIPSFKKVDSIYKAIQIPSFEIRDSYKILFDHYAKNNDIENQLSHIANLLEVDSLISSNSFLINDEIEKKYDIPILKNEKLKLEKELKKFKKHNSYKSYIGIIVLLLFISVIYFMYVRQKYYKKQYQKIILDLNSKSKAKKSTPSTKKVNINISDKVIADVLNKLEIFEKENGYLEKNLTLAILSKKLNTNSAYLSKIINHYKNKNFSNYLNKLKIEYAIRELSENKKLRKFTINAISNEVGFNTAESFSKAFFKEKKIYPSYFIKQLNKDKLI